MSEERFSAVNVLDVERIAEEADTCREHLVGRVLDVIHLHTIDTRVVRR